MALKFHWIKSSKYCNDSINARLKICLLWNKCDEYFSLKPKKEKKIISKHCNRKWENYYHWQKHVDISLDVMSILYRRNSSAEIIICPKRNLLMEFYGIECHMSYYSLCFPNFAFLKVTYNWVIETLQCYSPKHH